MTKTHLSRTGQAGGKPICGRDTYRTSGISTTAERFDADFAANPTYCCSACTKKRAQQQALAAKRREDQPEVRMGRAIRQELPAQ